MTIDREREAYALLHAGGESALIEAFGADLARRAVDTFVAQGKARWTTQSIAMQRTARWPGDTETTVVTKVAALRTFAKYAR